MVRLSADDAPTFDEPWHFTAAIEYSKHGDLRWGPDHPPLSRLIAGVPFRVIDVDVPETGPGVDALDGIKVGNEILYGSGRDAQHLIQVARLPIVGFTLLVVLVAFAFGWSLWGPASGLIAAAVASFDPTVIAHGHLVTTDMAVAGFALAAAWLLYLSYCSTSWRSMLLLVAGASCVGAAIASKFTALILLPIFAVLAALPGLRSGRWSRRLQRSAVRAGLLTVVAFAILWLAYLAVDTRLQYNRPLMSGSQPVGLFQTVARRLPAPLPFRDGLGAQIQGNSTQRPAFLLGERYYGGKVDFYPAVLLMKTPLGTLGLVALAAVLLLGDRRPGWGPRALYLLAVPSTVLGFAMASDTNIGVRHVLPVLLFGAVLCGAVASAGFGRLRQVAVGVLIAGLAASSLSAFPSHLAYINEAFGGGSRGYRQLSDSNIDWGQDLTRLAPVLRRLPPGEPVWLAYFGTVPPSAYGIHARTPDVEHLDQLRGGVFAVSVSILNTWQPGLYDELLAGLEPFEQVGHSILLYRIPSSPVTP